MPWRCNIMNTEHKIYIRGMEREIVTNIQAGMYYTAMKQIRDLIYYVENCGDE